MAGREEGAVAPNQRQGGNQQQNQEQAGTATFTYKLV